MSDTKIRLSDLRPAPPHIVGPTWQRRWDGMWHLPKASLGWDIIDWLATYVRMPGGEEDETFIPTDEQARFLLWWYAVDPMGRFSYRNGVLRRMKGWGKDPLVAAISLAELCGPVAFSHWDPDTRQPVGKRRPSAWIQVAAVSQDQTRNTFTLFPAMISERLKKEYKLDINKTIIYGVGGRMIEGVTSSPLALEGKRPTFVILNEIQWWVESNSGHAMYDVIEGNVTKSRLGSARYLAICNAHVPGQESIGERMWKTYEAVQSEIVVDTNLLYDSIEAPADTPSPADIPLPSKDLKLHNEGVQALIEGLKVARGDAIWLDLQTLAASMLDVNNAISESRRKFFNQINATEDQWISPIEWDKVRLEIAEPLLQGDRITLGFDGSKTQDHTALVACRVRDGLIQVIKVWDPKDYPSGEVPREQVDDMVNYVFSVYEVVGFRADMKEFESYVDQWSRKYKRKLKVKASPNNPVAFDMRGQTKRFAQDCERFKDAVLEGAVCHNDDRLLKAHINNAHMHPTNFGYVSIRKATKESSRKIDAAVSAVLAFGSRQDFLMSKKARPTGKVAVLQ